MRRICIALLALAAAASCTRGNRIELATQRDSIAYIIGMNVGRTLLGMDSTLNTAALCSGIRDAYAGTEKLTIEQARTYYLGYVNFELPQQAQRLEKQWLEEMVRQNRSYAQTASGLAYTVEQIGDESIVPRSDRDTVAFSYRATTVDGREFDSSYARQDTTLSPLTELLPGVREGVKLIGKGGKIAMWLPSTLAYGTLGNEDLGVKPNTTVYYEIELIDVVPYSPRRR